MPVVDVQRAVVKTPSKTYDKARFVFQDGKAAVWSQNGRSPAQILYTTDASLTTPKRRSDPYLLTLSDDTTWEITARKGGCGCQTPARGIPYTKLLSPVPA